MTESIKQWGEEYSQIKTQADALRATEIMEYIQTYYVPGDGYRSNPHTENQLQLERADALNVIGAALERFTGESHGANVLEWAAWRNEVSLE